MLKQLYIQNIAVIQKANIDFERGFNVFTGETGAGKTILISAIDAVLGERTSKEIIRTGEEKAFVTALFEDISPRARQKLEELGFEDEDGTVLITREIQASGKSACKIGGVPATAAILKEISSLLIHIHGQRDTSDLLAIENHIELIDLFGDTSDVISQYQAKYDEVCDIKNQLQSLEMNDSQKAQRIDMLSYQVKEIDDARLDDEDEEDDLTARKKLIKNSEKILDGLNQAYTALTGGEDSGGIEAEFDDLVDGITTAANFIEDFGEMSERISDISYELREFSSDIRSYLDDFDFDPRELDAVESRLDTIYKLKRKYGSTIAEIIEFGEKAREELELISTSDDRKNKLQTKLNALKLEATELAKKLSKTRSDAAERFTALIEAELAFLDMPAVKLSVKQTEKGLSANGIDDLEFMIVTNVGEAAKPLSKIASGGEMARIMLAIKNVLAEKDEIETLIFDEVDTGVSGRAAQKIGHKLKQVAKHRQVICVTHLAQVAAFSDNHMLIHKETQDGKTFTKIKVLENGAVIEELARITSGDLITETSLKSAQELYEHSQNMK